MQASLVAPASLVMPAKAGIQQSAVLRLKLNRRSVLDRPVKPDDES
jgi:hypothetical protein